VLAVLSSLEFVPHGRLPSHRQIRKLGDAISVARMIANVAKSGIRRLVVR
jgi:hypothetical protein